MRAHVLRAILDPKEKRKRGGGASGANIHAALAPIEDEVVMPAPQQNTELQSELDDTIFKLNEKEEEKKKAQEELNRAEQARKDLESENGSFRRQVGDLQSQLDRQSQDA